MMNWNPASNFTQDLKAVLEQLEGKHYTAYDDGTGRLTIGVGFNIADKDVRSYVFSAMGLDVNNQVSLTPAQRTAENNYITRLTTAIQSKDTQALDTIMKERADYYSRNGTPAGLQVRSSFAFNDVEITATLNDLLPLYDKKIWRDISPSLETRVEEVEPIPGDI